MKYINWKNKTIICLQCSNKFQPKENRPQKYCSRKCKIIYLGRKYRGYLPDGRPCHFCGKPIMRNGKIKNRWLYCSKKCMEKGKHLKAMRSGLFEKWALRKKAKQLGRPIPDNCEICGITFRDVITFKIGCHLRRRAFQIDHINPKSNGGNELPENKRCVCWFCNEVRCDSPIPDNIIKETAQFFWKKFIALYTDQ